MTVPFALSVDTFIKDVGADAGFASIIGLALLVLLYFAQMRETRTLRDQLEEASGRIGHLENRLAHVSRVQGAPGVQPPVVPAPSIAVRPMGSAIAALRRSASAVSGGTGLPAGAPMGLAGPALMSATKLIPTAFPEPAAPGAIPSVAPDPNPTRAPKTAPVPAPPVFSPAAPPSPVAAPLSSPAAVGATTTQDTVLVAPSTAAAGGNGHAPVSLGDDQPAVAPLSPPRRPVREPPPRAPRRLAPLPHGPAEGRPRGRRIASVVLVALGLIAVAVAAVIVLTRSTSPPPQRVPVKHHKIRKAVTPRHRPAPTFNPANVTVAVLNGTAIANLAHNAGAKLSGDGYKVPAIANGAVQTQTSTVVSYQRGHAADAGQVAKALGLSPTAVQAADATTLQFCDNAPSATGTSTATATCPADVIVTLGTDLASLAQNTGSG